MNRDTFPGMNPHAHTSSMLTDDLADHISLACPAELDAIIRDAWADHTHGLLTENEVEALDEAAWACREPTQERKPRRAASGALRGPARSLRSIRTRTRRRLHEPRPAVSPETRARRGQWRARVEAAQLAGEIGKGVHLYLFALLDIPSVQRGDYCLYADAQMARRLNNIHVDTVRDHRKQAEKAGLIEVLGHGRDHKPCLVRPILDGNSVFQTGNCAWPSQVIVPVNLLLTEDPKGSPPLSPTTEPGGEGGRAFDRFEEEPIKPTEATDGSVELMMPVKSGMISPDTAEGADQVPAEPGASREIPAQPPTEQTVSAEPTKPETASKTIQQPCGPASAGRVPFEELWRLNPRGWIGRARTAWLRLSDAQTHAAKADLEAILRRGPLPEGFDYAATHFAMIRHGQPAAPILVPTAALVRVPEQVFIRENTPEWRCWRRHLVGTKGKSTPVNSQGGWWFPSKLPPLTDAEVLPKGQAIRTNTCARKQA